MNVSAHLSMLAHSCKIYQIAWPNLSAPGCSAWPFARITSFGSCTSLKPSAPAGPQRAPAFESCFESLSVLFRPIGSNRTTGQFAKRRGYTNGISHVRQSPKSRERLSVHLFRLETTVKPFKAHSDLKIDVVRSLVDSFLDRRMSYY